MGFERRYALVLSRSLIFVVILKRWEVWLKLACSILAFSRWVLIVSFEAKGTGSFHLHCIRAWVLLYGVGVIESALSLAWGMNV